MSYFSEKIKCLRLKEELTQKEISEAIGVSQSTYSGLESGKADPSLSALIALSKYYNEFVDSLISSVRLIEDNELDEDERTIIRLFNQLDTRDKVDITTYLRTKISKHREEST